MTIFGGNFLAESAYLKLPFWRGSGGKSGPGGFLRKEMKAQKAKMKGNEGPKGQNERK